MEVLTLDLWSDYLHCVFKVVCLHVNLLNLCMNPSMCVCVNRSLTIAPHPYLKRKEYNVCVNNDTDKA